MSALTVTLAVAWGVCAVGVLVVGWRVASKTDRSEPDFRDVDDLALRRRINERLRREAGL